MAKFVVSHLDEQMGPFEEHELKAKWVKGELLPIDYVFDDVKQDWVLLTEKFPWASGKVEGVMPPPLREISVKKRRPDLDPVKDTIEVTGTFTGPFLGASTQTAITTVQSLATPLTPPPAPLEPPKRAPAPAPKPVPAPAASAPVPVFVPAAPPISASAFASAAQAAQVTLQGGVGELDLSLVTPGQVELVLQTPGLALDPLKIKVTPAEPFAIEWAIPQQKTVGEEIAIHIRALDRTGLLCSHYEDYFVVRVNGASGKEFNLHMKNGECLLKFQHTKSEVWNMSFHYAGSRVLKLPEDRTLEWLPGPAAKLILDGPGEYIAGHPMKVHVKAVDSFGNLAKSFSGTVVLEVKAS